MKLILKILLVISITGISGHAFGQVPFIDIAGQSCVAHATGGSPGNSFAGAYGDARTHFVVTPRGKVIANCHGPDGSGIYEDTAENGKIDMDDCTILLPDGSIAEGSGHFTAAANDTDSCFDGESTNCGGNFSMHCKGYIVDDGPGDEDDT